MDTPRALGGSHPGKAGRRTVPLLYLLFQINASPKFNNLAGRDGDGFTGAGVVALAFLAFFDDERTEAGQGELSVGGEGFLYGVEQGDCSALLLLMAALPAILAISSALVIKRLLSA